MPLLGMAHSPADRIGDFGERSSNSIFFVERTRNATVLLCPIENGRSANQICGTHGEEYA